MIFALASQFHIYILCFGLLSIVSNSVLNVKALVASRGLLRIVIMESSRTFVVSVRNVGWREAGAEHNRVPGNQAGSSALVCRVSRIRGNCDGPKFVGAVFV